MPGGTGGWELVEEERMLSNVDRLVDEAIELAAATPLAPGVRDLVLMPSHLALTIHEIVAHATELDRVVGYEANYAGTSFVKVGDIGKLKYGSKLFNISGDKVRPGGRATVGYDDDGVKTTKFPIVRDGHSRRRSRRNREIAHYINEKESRGCTQATTLARLSVPADAERAPRAGTGRIADARADHRRHEGRRAHRRDRAATRSISSATTASSAAARSGRSRTARRRAR